MTRPHRLLPAALVVLLELNPLTAGAQAPMGLPPAGGPISADEAKPEGVAEQAPKEPGKLPTMPVLPPWPGEKRKRFELLELDGYFRMRTDWFSALDLGFHDLGTGVPFREALTCLEGAPAGVKSFCSDSVGTANLRLRLEPVLNLSEQVSVHFQVDVLDNVVLGATPDGVVLAQGTSPPANVPANAFSGGQVEPDATRNWAWDSVRVKRAWGEVKIPDLGVLRFGRMPSHWGLGLLANGGGTDPFRGTTCLDCDYGDSADRIMFGTMIPGTGLRAAVGMDWASSEPSAGQVDIWKNRYDGQPWDLDDADDVRQWVFVLAHLDGPEAWRDKVDQGGLALNYGAYFVYRAQDVEARGYDLGSTSPQATLVPRGASAYIPDLYLRLGYRKLSVEAEAVAVYGSIDDLSDISAGVIDQNILQLGGVGRLSYLMLDDDLNLGLEVGYASGDQWEALAAGTINVRDAPFVPQDPSDQTISNFRFDFDYHVDLILFRELIGTVTNATYVKPTLAYNLTNRFVLKAQAVASFANVPVATPGNSDMYGVELDGDLGYNNTEEGFFAGVSYGVLFPMGALDHPAGLFPPAEQGEASTAQTFQTRLVLKF